MDGNERVNESSTCKNITFVDEICYLKENKLLCTFACFD